MVMARMLMPSRCQNATDDTDARMPKRMPLPRWLLMLGYQEDSRARKVVHPGMPRRMLMPRRLLMLGSKEDADAKEDAKS